MSGEWRVVSGGYEFSDAERNLELLDGELRRLELPGYQGVGRHVKRRGPDGVVMASAPYLLVEVDRLSDQQLGQLDEVIASHDPAERTPAQLAMDAASAELARRRDAAVAAVARLAKRAAGGDELARDLVAILAGVGGWGLGVGGWGLGVGERVASEEWRVDEGAEPLSTDNSPLATPQRAEPA